MYDRSPNRIGLLADVDQALEDAADEHSVILPL